MIRSNPQSQTKKHVFRELFQHSGAFLVPFSMPEVAIWASDASLKSHFVQPNGIPIFLAIKPLQKKKKNLLLCLSKSNCWLQWMSIHVSIFWYAKSLETRLIWVQCVATFVLINNSDRITRGPFIDILLKSYCLPISQWRNKYYYFVA